MSPDALALTLDPETGDLALSGGRLALGRPAATVASIVAASARGEIKDAPLLGGEALRRAGGPRPEAWLARLGKQLRAAGLTVGELRIDDDGAVRMTVG